jgi:hypothetical protein
MIIRTRQSRSRSRRLRRNLWRGLRCQLGRRSERAGDSSRREDPMPVVAAEVGRAAAVETPAQLSGSSFGIPGRQLQCLTRATA